MTGKNKKKFVISCEPDDYTSLLPPIKCTIEGNKISFSREHNIRLQFTIKDNPVTIYPAFKLRIIIDELEHSIYAKFLTIYQITDTLNVVYAFAGSEIDTTILTGTDEFSNLLINKNFRFDANLHNSGVELLETENEVDLLDDEMAWLLEKYPKLNGKTAVIFVPEQQELALDFHIVQITRTNENNPPISKAKIRVFNI